MEKEDNNHKHSSSNNNNNQTTTTSKSLEPEFVLQWGKRLRCSRTNKPNKSAGGAIRRQIISRIVSADASAATDPTFSPFNRLTRATDGSRNGKSPSPDKEERYYSTRGSTAGEEKENGRTNVEGNGVGLGVGVGVGVGIGGGEDKGNFVWPKLYISLSSKEKEEDFLAMKGCKLPQRPKKRAKMIQRTLLLVSPGAWLPEMCQERYEVREKKTPKKRPRGLKAMGSIVDSESE